VLTIRRPGLDASIAFDYENCGGSVADDEQNLDAD